MNLDVCPLEYIYLPHTFLGKVIAAISIDSRCIVDLFACSIALPSSSKTVFVSGFEIGYPGYGGILLKAKSSRVLSLVSGKVRYTTVWRSELSDRTLRF